MVSTVNSIKTQEELSRTSPTPQQGGSNTQIGNALNGAGKEENVSTPDITLDNIKDKAKRTQPEVDKELNDIVKSYNIPLEQVKKLIARYGYTDEKLLTIDLNEFNIIKLCLSKALIFSYNNGKVDNKELITKFLAYKWCIVDANMTQEEAATLITQIDEDGVYAVLKEKSIKDPQLKKLIGNRDIKQLDTKELKTVLQTLITSNLNKSKQKNPRAFLDFYAVLINKCNDDDKNKFFAAFAELLKDKKFMEQIQEAFGETVKSFIDANKLLEFVNGGGAKTLTKMGFNEKSIAIIKQSAYVGLEKEQFGQLLDTITKTIQEKLTPEKLAVFFKAMTGSKLNAQEQKIYSEIANDINSAVELVAAGLERKQNGETENNDKLYGINNALNDKGLSDYAYDKLNEMYEQNPEMFNSMSKDEFIKNLNEITDNKFGEHIGDTNPDNLYNKENADIVQEHQTQEIGFASQITIAQVDTANEYIQIFQTQQNESEKDNNTFKIVGKQDKDSSKYDKLFDLTDRTIISNDNLLIRALEKGKITIGYLGENFNHLCNMGKKIVFKVLDYNPSHRIAWVQDWGSSELIEYVALKDKLDKDEIQNLNVDTATKQIIMNECEKNNKPEVA